MRTVLHNPVIAESGNSIVVENNHFAPEEVCTNNKWVC